MLKRIPLFLFLVGLLLTQNSFAQTTGFVAGEVLIQLHPQFKSEDFAKKMEADFGYEVSDALCISDVMNIYLIRFENINADLSSILRSLEFYPEVIAAQKNHLVYERETIPSDTLFDNQWHHKNTGQTGGTVDADMDTPDAWDITTGGLTTHGDTIVVCIIEGNGVDINHIDLKDNIWKNYGEIPGDLIDNDNNGYIDDFNGWHVINEDDVIGAGAHGTRVAGMIGASGNNVTGVAGVNWNVKMMVVQGQQASNEASVIAAYTYPLKMRKRYNETLGQEGAFVVATNSSWGIDGGDPADSPLWCAMYDSLGAYGILNIAATTNNNQNVDVVGDLPTTCVSEFLIGVTMTNSQDLRANSGYGTTHVDIGAPGQLVQTTSPSGAYSTSSGTSFATPAMAGCVALAYSAPCTEFISYVKFDPAGAALDMRTYFLETVDQNAGLLAEVASGGRVNVKSCIDSILNACDPNPCSAPYNLSLLDLSDTSANLSWEGFSTQSVLWFGPYGGTLVPTDFTGVMNSLHDTLTPCSYYTFSVQSVCGTDTSSMSFPLTFQTDGCCENPALVLNSNTLNTITLDWPDVVAATSYNVRYKLSSEVTWTELVGVNAPYTFNSLTPCAYYDFQIHTQCADSTHGYGPTQSFTTLGCGACTEKTYCSVSGANTDLEWIQGISVNGFTNSTGSNSGWLQSNQIITALTPGASYNITFTPGYAGFNFTEGFSVWIDFDQDGTFAPGENLITNLTANTSVTGILNIPLTAQIGVTKMRIGMNATAIPEICPATAFYGEYEDYCVYIGPQTGLYETQKPGIFIYPNPANEFLYVECSEPIVSVSVLDYTGKIIRSETLPVSNQISLAGLSTGVYFIRVETSSGTMTSKFIKTNE